MKKVISILLIIMLSIVMTIPTFAETKGVINTETARIRSEADSSASILKLISMSDEVSIISEEGDWYKVKYDGVTGYVSKSLVDVSNSDESSKTSTSKDTKQEATEETSTNTTKETKTTESETDDVTETNEQTDTAESKQEETVIDLTEDYVGKIGKDVTIKIVPSINSNDIDTIKADTQITITEIINNWCYIETDDSCGWARLVAVQKAVDAQNEEQETAQNVEEEQEVATVEEQRDVVVTSRAAETARLLQSQREESSEATTSATTSTKTASTSAEGEEVANFAKQYLQYKYVSGGSSPSTGFDCSGFTSYVYSNFGVSLSRSSSGQQNNGVSVAKSDIQAGDLLIFNNNSNTEVGHVGIYIGNNQFIHAANASSGVKITSLSDSYYQARYVDAKRVL